MSNEARTRKRGAGLAAISLVTLGLATTAVAAASKAATVVPGYPVTPPAQVCGNAALLNGPSVQPPGSVRVDPGTSLPDLTNAHPAGTTFWLTAGTHTLGTSEWGQVIPKSGNVYIGAPGAVLDGKGLNRYAFTQEATDVAIRYLTIQNFVPPFNEGVVNQGVAASWTVENSTIANNEGAGVIMGDSNVVRYNCLSANGQYGFSVYKPTGVRNVTLDHNEISYNDVHDLARTDPACGCFGGGKFWDVEGATVTNNWVHDNKGQGLWADTNAIGFLIEGNYINDNDHEGILYETSYNANIHNNTLKRNALAKGRVFAARNDTFPVTAIYISESGGDSRVNRGVYSSLEISGNYLEDNWGGVVLWENANRFCSSAGSTADGYCPKAGVATVSTCVAGIIDAEPYYSDCRWKTQNVLVHDNDFRIDKTALRCAGTQCGQQGLFSNEGNSPEWSPYRGTMIQDAITFKQKNRFANNRYVGDWHFTAYAPGRVLDLAAWQAAPYEQDRDSTLVGTAPSTTAAPPTTTVATTTTLAVETNILDADTRGLEGSTGRWAAWYSTDISRSTARAHTGSASLRVDVTHPYGWGVTLNNYPGFAAVAGAKRVSFWASAGTGESLGATLRVAWRDAFGTDLKTDVVTIPTLGPAWQQGTASVTAPTGTASVWLDLVHSSGGPGDSLFIDDVVVANA